MSQRSGRFAQLFSRRQQPDTPSDIDVKGQQQQPESFWKHWPVWGFMVFIGLAVLCTVSGVLWYDQNNGVGSQQPQTPLEPPGPLDKHPVSPYANMTLLKTLDGPHSALVEGPNKGRVFVVGDVHGHLDALNKLLEKIQFNSTQDKLVLAGDMVAKGPDSLGVLRRARELGLLCVRGNHDDKVVRFKTYGLVNGAQTLEIPNGVLPEGPVSDPIHFQNQHAAIARVLSQEDYDYLVSCPVILEIPSIQAAVVHGGLDPARLSLQDQDPYLVMRMRRISRNGRPTEKKKGSGWSEAWNQKQATLDKKDRRYVYYGHDASRGLLLLNYTFGLDSGCARGDLLTAIEVTSKKLTQVSCV